MNKLIATKEGKALTRNGKVYTHECNGGGNGEGYPEPIGVITITENGTHNVKDYANANVDVPIPSDYIKPTGKIEITSTEEIDVSSYAKAQVVDSNLVAENILKDVTILGVTGTFEGGGGGDHTQEDGLIDGSITSYSNDRVTSVGERTFCYKKLESVSFPNVTNVGKYAFQYCETKSFNLPNATIINDNAFDNCKELISISLPNVTTLKSSVFRYATKLENVDLPNLTSVSSRVFEWCEKLKSVNIPKLKEVYNGTFSYCNTIESVILPSCYGIYGQSFQNCYSLKKIVIEYNTRVCNLYANNIFSNCYHILGTVNSTYNPNGDKDGYIYVPASLLSQYKVASNWVNFETQIIGHQDFNVGDTLPSYANDTYTTCTWYSDETLTQVVTSVATQGRYYCRLEA